VGWRRRPLALLPKHQIEPVVEAPLPLAAPDGVKKGLQLSLQIGRNLTVHVVLPKSVWELDTGGRVPLRSVARNLSSKAIRIDLGAVPS
jgi:hypothetical protein